MRQHRPSSLAGAFCAAIASLVIPGALALLGMSSAQAAEGPDLVVVDGSIAVVVPPSGQPIATFPFVVRATIKNVGTLACPATSATIEGVVLPVPLLNVGQEYVIQATLTRATSGSFTVNVRADSGYVVNETNDSNNTAYRTISLLPAKPDLMVVAGSIAVTPASPIATQSFTVSAVIKNVGPVGIIATVADIEGVKVPTPSLAPGQQAAIQASVTKAYSGTTTITVRADYPSAVDEVSESNTASKSVTVLPAKPDLQLSSLQIIDPTQPLQSGVPFGVRIVVANVGQVAAPESRLQVADQTKPIGALGPGASQTVDVLLTRAVTGTFAISAKADSTLVINNEITEGNNSKTLSVIIQPGPPDLFINSLNYTPVPPKVAVPTLINVTVRNLSNTTSSPASVVEALVDGHPELTKRMPVPILSAFATTPVITLPVTFTAPGLYTVMVSVDPDNQITELHDDNNRRAFTVTVAVGPADLTLSSLRIVEPAPYAVGKALTVEAVVKNLGPASASVSEAAIKLGAETAPMTFKINDLALNATQTITRSYTPTLAGVLAVSAIADYSGRLVEANEANNAKMLTAIIGAAPRPDLLIPSVTVDPATAAVAGKVVRLLVAVKNQGTAPAAASALRLALTSLGETNATAPRLNVPALAVNETQTVSREVTLPPTALVLIGTAVVDPDNAILEVGDIQLIGVVIGASLNGPNNTKLFSFPVQPAPKPDLIISSLTVDPVIPVAGTAFTIRAIVKNLGVASAAASKAEIKIGADGTMTPPTFDVPELASGAEYTVSRVFTPAINSVSAVITATADKLGQVTEQIETNNIKVFLVAIAAAPKPDLVISVPALNPAQPAAGQPVAISVIVTNQGKADAGAFDVEIKIAMDVGTAAPRISVAGLKAGQSYTVTRQGAILASSGDSVKATADVGNQVSEVSELNNTSILTIAATNKPPVCQPLGNLTGSTASAVSMTAACSDPEGKPLQYAWDFGDGATGSGSPTTHQYDAAGAYAITVTATDSAGASGEASGTITITEGPAPSGDADLIVSALTVSPAAPAVGQPFTITATVKNIGTGAAPASRTALQVVGESNPTWHDTAALAAGASIQVTGTRTIAAAGPAMIYATANGDMQPFENVMTNNNRSVSFTVGTAADTAPPIVSLVKSLVAATGVTISWNTNESSDSQVEYGTTTAYGTSNALNTARVISHGMVLAALAPNILYHYRVKSRDAAGNLATSGDFTFSSAGLEYCDPTMSSDPVNGLWKARWGAAGTDPLSREPMIHPCGANQQSTRLVTTSSTLPASGLEWKVATPGRGLRNADVSFLVPSLPSQNWDGWTHIASMPAYDPPASSPGLESDFGRIGGAAFKDKLFIEFLKFGNAGCPAAGPVNPGAGDHLFAPATIDAGKGLQPDHWYRLNAQIRELNGGTGGLEVKALLYDLQGVGAPRQIASAAKVFPVGCTPPWYGIGDSRWIVGALGQPTTNQNGLPVQQNIETIVDDFTGRPKP